MSLIKMALSKSDIGRKHITYRNIIPRGHYVSKTIYSDLKNLNKNCRFHRFIYKENNKQRYINETYCIVKLVN